MEPHHGIYPILYAFFGADGALDRDAMRRQAEACVAMGAHGVAALGLATEVSKLSAAERRDVMEWLAEDVNGRAPVAITVFGATPEEQIGYVRAAADLGAAWVILQPPQDAPRTEAELIRFFGRVMDASPIAVAATTVPTSPRPSITSKPPISSTTASPIPFSALSTNLVDSFQTKIRRLAS